MKKPNTKRKLRAVLIAALFGAGLFAAVTGCVEAIHDHFWGHDADASLALNLVLSIPTLVAWHFTGLEHSTFGQSLAFGFIVNGLLGALFFAISTAFWQFIVKDGHENKSTGI